MDDNFNQDPLINTTPVTSVAFDDILGHKTAEGTNFFTDDHIGKVKGWNSDDPTKAKFRTPDGKIDIPKLTKSYLELENRLGRLNKPLPEDATEADRFEHHKQIQRMLDVPPTPEDYEIIVPADLPEGIQVVKEDVNALKLMAHKHNGSRDLVQAIFDMGWKRDAARMQKEAEALTKQVKETEAHLKAEWGPDEFVRKDDLLQRYIHDFTQSDEEFDAVFEGITNTNFRGGPRAREVFFKALCKAAEIIKGEGQGIVADTEKRIEDKERVKTKYPKSHAFLSS